MGGAGAGQPADDDGPFDLQVVDLGVTEQQVPDQQPVLEELEQLGVPGDDTGGAEPRFVTQGVAQHVESGAEGGIAEVIESGLLPGGGTQGGRVDGAEPGHVDQ